MLFQDFYVIISHKYLSHGLHQNMSGKIGPVNKMLKLYKETSGVPLVLKEQGSVVENVKVPADMTPLGTATPQFDVDFWEMAIRL